MNSPSFVIVLAVIDRDLTYTASVVGAWRRWNTRSTPSSSTRDVETLSSSPLVRMHVAATRCSTALPMRAESRFSIPEAHQASSLGVGSRASDLYASRTAHRVGPLWEDAPSRYASRTPRQLPAGRR